MDNDVQHPQAPHDRPPLGRRDAPDALPTELPETGAEAEDADERKHADQPGRDADAVDG